MTRLTLSANSAFLEQILEFAKNLAKEQNEKLEVQQDRFAKQYEDDIEAYKKGELSSKSLDEMLEEIEKWY